MFPAYKTAIHCQQSQEVLEQIMEEAVDWYLSFQPNVFPIERHKSQITLKVQKSYRSNGELITISICKESFTIVSECIDESTQLLAWSKNRENVVCLSACLKNEAKGISYSAA